MRPDHAALGVTLTNQHHEQTFFIFNFGLNKYQRLQSHVLVCAFVFLTEGVL